MRTVYLVARRDDETGELGLQIEGAHGRAVNSATEGLLIAHDLIEHPSIETLGRIDDELEALGAIWMCRGRHGELRRDSVGSAYSIEENLASDVTRMAVDLLNGAETYLDIPRRTRAHEHDDAFREIIEIARRDIPGEYGDSLDREQRAKVESYLAGALHLMRTGARKLMRRYPGQFSANNQFWAIADAVDPYAKGIEYEGARYKLTYGNTNDRGRVAYCAAARQAESINRSREGARMNALEKLLLVDDAARPRLTRRERAGIRAAIAELSRLRAESTEQCYKIARLERALDRATRPVFCGKQNGRP